MIDTMTTPWLFSAIPLIGALLGLVVWSQPKKLKIWSIIMTLLSLLTVIVMSERLPVPTEGLLLLYLLPLSACISLLGSPIHSSFRFGWVMTLLFLGLGLGGLTIQHTVGQLALVFLLGLITWLLYSHHSGFGPPSWWGIGTYGLGALCVLLAAIAGPSLSPMLALVVCAILLPLAPFHDGYVAALTRLPGNLPSFIVLLLPALGLHALATLIPTVPDAVISTVTIIALAGMLYSAIKALAQSRVQLLLAYGSLSFFSLLWWFVVASRTVMPQAVIFLSAVAIVTSGLLVAWQVIRTRYGNDVDPRSISGLAWTMPQFAVLLSLLTLAAMGLPPFGVFAGFMGLLFNSVLISAGTLLVMSIAWLAASWYILDMVQRLLFGQQRANLRYEDLHRSELASLLMAILIAIALGIAPISLVKIEHQLSQASTVTKAIS